MKDNFLNEQEIQNLSKLLLSTDSANIEIGLQVIKNHPTNIDSVCTELVLISQLSWNDNLRKSAYKILKKNYPPEQLEQWNEQFKIFHTYENLYDHDDFKNNWHLFEKHEEIRASFVPFIIQNNDYVAEYITLAECINSYYKKKLDWAERYYLMALQFNPKDLSLLSTLADLYKDGFYDYNKTADYYHQILAIDPLHYDVLEAKGILYFSYLKKYDEAISIFEAALSHYPDDENLQVWLADTYMTKNTPETFEKGKRILLDILEKKPKNSFALTIYANQLWMTENKPEEAKEIYLRILDISPQQYNVLGNLAELHYLSFLEYNVAQSYYAKAFSIYMDDIFHLCNYISLLVLHLNEFADAKDFYEHLLTLCYNGVQREPETTDEQWVSFQKAEQLLLDYIKQQA